MRSHIDSELYNVVTQSIMFVFAAMNNSGLAVQ